MECFNIEEGKGRNEKEEKRRQKEGSRKGMEGMISKKEEREGRH